MAQDKIRIGILDYVKVVDGISLVDDASLALSLTGITSGLLFVKYETAAGVEYSATFSIYMTADALAILILSNTTDFDDADTDAKFDVYSNGGVITLKNRTAGTVTANVTIMVN